MDDSVPGVWASKSDVSKSLRFLCAVPHACVNTSRAQSALVPRTHRLRLRSYEGARICGRQNLIVVGKARPSNIAQAPPAAALECPPIA